MAEPKTIGGVRNANLRLVIECRRCAHLVAYSAMLVVLATACEIVNGIDRRLPCSA